MGIAGTDLLKPVSHGSEIAVVAVGIKQWSVAYQLCQDMVADDRSLSAAHIFCVDVAFEGIERVGVCAGRESQDLLLEAFESLPPLGAGEGELSAELVK